MKGNKSYRNKGFTLIELMVAMAIMSILIGMAAFTYVSQLTAIHLRNDSREVDQALQLAKMRALATGRDHGVVFDLSSDGADRYYIFIDCNPSPSDLKFTQANFDNNTPVGTWDKCETATYDPRISDKGIFQTHENDNILFDDDPSGIHYILFNHLGQAHQEGDLKTVNIHVRSKEDNNGRKTQILIKIIGGTGLTDIYPMQIL